MSRPHHNITNPCLGPSLFLKLLGLASLKYPAESKSVQEKMNTYEAECHQLTDQIRDMQKAFDQIQSDKAALEAALREATSPSGGREAPGQASTSQPAFSQPSRPLRPTPKGWVCHLNWIFHA